MMKTSTLAAAALATALGLAACGAGNEPEVEVEETSETPAVATPDAPMPSAQPQVGPNAPSTADTLGTDTVGTGVGTATPDSSPR